MRNIAGHLAMAGFVRLTRFNMNHEFLIGNNVLTSVISLIIIVLDFRSAGFDVFARSIIRNPDEWRKG
jgi:hypothetical protein